MDAPANGPSERQDVTFCESGTYSRKLMPEMMKDPDGGITPQDLRKIQFQPSPTQPTVIEVPPGFVKHWVAPRLASSWRRRRSAAAASTCSRAAGGNAS
jgi:hypothetical protein